VDLVEQTGLPKTTLHRLCWKLVELGMLEHARGGFRVGTKLFALGSMNVELRRLRAIAMPHLHQLVARTGWATNLAVPADGRALIVEEVYGASTHDMRRMVGACLPLHATAVGKALLSGFDEETLSRYVGDALLRPFTRNTVVRPNVLRGQLDAIRRGGVAYSHEEWALGTSGVAAPVHAGGTVVAAIATVGPPGAAGMRRCADAVRLAALTVAQELGPVTAPAAA
jgi:DNA-binding IclR family transcriptional regulator